MKKISIARNFVYNSALSIVNIAYPLITFPYVNRVLGVEGIGKVNFVWSLAAIFAIVGGFGVQTYGTREVARARDSQQELSRVVSRLLALNVLFTLLSVALYSSGFAFIEKMRSDPWLFALGGLSVVFSSVTVEWFYTGSENYAYISARSITLRALSLIAVFVLVRSKSGYVTYFLINLLSSALICALNVYGARKAFFWSGVLKDAGRSMRSLTPLFLQTVFSAVYLNAGNLVLGFMVGDRAVGVYSTCSKIVQVAIVLVNALGGVLSPRASYLFGNAGAESYRTFLSRVWEYNLLLSVPLAFGVFFTARDALQVFGGAAFLEGTTTLQVLSCVILISGASSFLGGQILIPQGHEQKVMVSAAIGASIAVLATPLLARSFTALGAATAFCLSEIAVLLFQYAAVRSGSTKDEPRLGVHPEIFAAGAIMGAVLFGLNRLLPNSMARLAWEIAFGILTYVAVLFLTRNRAAREILFGLRQRFGRTPAGR